MSDIAEHDYIRLIKVSYDIAPTVLRSFAKNFIIKPFYDNSFIKFLDKRKHALYHAWQAETPCCQCSETFQKKAYKLKREQFEKIYEISKRKAVCSNGKGVMRSKGKVTQYCLCNIETKNKTIRDKELDLTMLCLIIHDPCLNQEYIAEVENILIHRNKIAHAYSSKSFSSCEFIDIMGNLERSILKLATISDEDLHDSVKDHMVTMKSARISEEEYKSLLEKDECFFDVMKQLGLIERIVKTQEEMRQEMNENHLKMNRSLQEIKQRIGTFEEKFGLVNATINMDYLNLHRTQSQEDGNPRDVTSSLEAEADNLDEENVIKKVDLHRGRKLRGRFKINSVQQNCILMDLEANTDIFQDKDAFLKALRPLLSMIIDYGHLDRNLRGAIKINLTFKDLTEEELNVLQELAKPERYNCFRCKLLEMEVNNLRGIETKLQKRLRTEIEIQNKFEQETLNLQSQLQQAKRFEKLMKQEELRSWLYYRKVSEETDQASHSDSASQASEEYFYERTAFNRSFKKERFDRISISSDTSTGALTGEKYKDVDQQSQVHSQETASEEKNGNPLQY
ncbi:unnamed protein product [Mytilus coruscus]|uniref:DZIP3-like HEPN domain-containing protein n=1 Tax=Mytilus coruscus TaxID=42192 RepID=A0A6J8AJY3_MYTCO|nr:unnamed protein product [Mytilus coruscus]